MKIFLRSHSAAAQTLTATALSHPTYAHNERVLSVGRWTRTLNKVLTGGQKAFASRWMITEHRHKNKRAADRLFAVRAREFEVFARTKRTRIMSYKYHLNKDKLENYFAIFSENRKTTHRYILMQTLERREMLFFSSRCNGILG